MNISSTHLWPPLRDMQQQPPLWLCPRCGQEQYPGDRRYDRAGRTVCESCLHTLGREEQEQYHEII